MFTEANTVEAYVRDLLCGSPRSPCAAEPTPTYNSQRTASSAAGLGWRFIAPALMPRQPQEALIEPWVRDALIRLNPAIADKPSLADEVLYKLRAIVLAVRSDGLVRANEEMMAWLRGDRTMPFGPKNEHVPIRLVDFSPENKNEFIVTTQFTFRSGPVERRADLILFINGFPVVLGEAKTPVRPAVTWVDGAAQVHLDYERNIPELFVSNIFSFATEGKEYRFGSIALPLDKWSPWRLDDAEPLAGALDLLRVAVHGMLRREVVLDLLANFTVFGTDRKNRRIKTICRYQQYEAANKIVDRVVGGKIRKGLIWHFQGSGKSLLMVFAAQKLRMHAALRNPTVLVVVDRIDLDAQLSATFNEHDIPNTVNASTREELETLLRQDVRKIVLTTIFRFAECQPDLNRRDNIIVLVDEAHRTQEGDLGQRMRKALPNAFLFGLTGTPINRRDRNTFWAFGAEEDEKGYLSRYSFEESIRDGATLPLHFEPRLVEIHLDKATIDQGYAELTDSFTELDRDTLAKAAARMAVLVKAPERVHAIVADIVRHYREHVEPNGFKAQIVAYDRECCMLYKKALDEVLPAEASEVVITVNSGEEQYKAFKRGRDEEEKLLDRFRDPASPLDLLIVTSKLLTGFDAPILQTMYLDKPLRDHTLLQAICRANRPYPEKKFGLIVDYLGVFDDVGRALDFDEKSMLKVVSNIAGLKQKLPEVMQRCLMHYPGIDRSVAGYAGLIAAQECLPNNEARDAFAADYSYLSALWEALSPDAVLGPFEKDYKWLTHVYQSVQPPGGHGKLLWHTLGAKTIELIHANIHVEAVHDDLETLVLDANILAEIAGSADPKKKAKAVEIKLTYRLRKHLQSPKFKPLSERLEKLRERHEQGLLSSIDFLKELLQLAKDVVQAEKEMPPEEEPERGKAALTELLEQVRNRATPIIVERVVNDVDSIVRLVRFPGWQNTKAGEREVKQALRKTLFKYKLHEDQDLFDKAYGYIRQYY